MTTTVMMTMTTTMMMTMMMTMTTVSVRLHDCCSVVRQLVHWCLAFLHLCRSPDVP